MHRSESANRPVGAYNMQSIAGMLAHFYRPEDLTNWVPLEVSTTFMAVDYVLVARVLVSHYVLGALLLLGALCASRRAGRPIFDDQVALTAAPGPRPAATTSRLRITNWATSRPADADN
jgi:hypothetical protein